MGPCRDHPDTPAVATCATCASLLCVECTKFEDFKPYCFDHAKPARTKKYGRVLFGVVGGSVVFVGAIVAFLAWAIFHEPPHDYGKHEHEVGELREELLSAPCDKTKTLRLGNLLLETRDYDAAVELVDRHRKKCGEWPRLLWVRYSANKYSGQYEEALADATFLIEDDPDDKDYRWWRGIVHEMRGDWEKAATDYEKAIEIEPRLTNIPFNLSAVYEEMNRPCDAARAIERFLEAHPDQETESRTTARLKRLREACSG